jgi:hypothetical protein
MKHPHNLSSAAMAHLNELLDEALKQTFPASDPIAINSRFRVHWFARRGAKGF